MGVQMSLQKSNLSHLYIYPEIGFMGHIVIRSDFMRNFHTAFHSHYTTLHSLQFTKVPFFQYCQHLLSLIFLIIGILTCSVQSLNHVRLIVSPWTAAHQAFLSITNSWSLLKLMSIRSGTPYNHSILCCPLLLLPSIFSNIKVFSNE